MASRLTWQAWTELCVEAPDVHRDLQERIYRKNYRGEIISALACGISSSW
jgi:hypothetical protein